jgi:hypothetical protein
MAGAAMSALTRSSWRIGIALVLSVLAGGCASMQPVPTGPERPPLAAYGVTQRYVAGELEFGTCRLVECPQPTPKTRPQPSRTVASGLVGQGEPTPPKPMEQQQ